MKTKTLALILLMALMGQFSFSQEEELILTAKDSVVISSWIFGLGFNAVDDSGDELSDLFAFDSEWNVVPFPSRISIGRYFKSGVGLEAIASYNQYKEGKIIDAQINDSDKSYFAFDTRISYDLNKIFGETGWFDPYVGAGLGYTDANDAGRGTVNGTVGFRTWFSDRWGLDFNSSGKWSFNNATASNHLQHAAGVVYRFDIEKGLTKKGKEKLALIQAINQENQQRKADSIAAAQKQAEEEAKALAERLEREKEAARLAAAEKAKEDAENKRRQDLRAAVEALGLIYFNLNSSYLNNESKEVLDQLAAIMEQNPTLRLSIGSHTDSRGTNNYNLWLSEKRAKRTVEYLISKGISEDRLNGTGSGEEQLANDCKDGVPCSETQHRVNRRSAFEIISF